MSQCCASSIHVAAVTSWSKRMFSSTWKRFAQSKRYALISDAGENARVHFGFRSPPFGTAEFDTLEVLSQLLAGGRGSRLYRRLVREQKIAQDVAAFALPLFLLLDWLLGFFFALPQEHRVEIVAAITGVGAFWAARLVRRRDAS